MNTKYGPLFSIEHRSSYVERYLITNAPISGLCFNNRFAWSVNRFYQYKIIEDCACLYTDGEEGIASQHIVFPLGELNAEKLEKIVDFYYPAFEQRGNPLKIIYVSKDHFDVFNGIKGYDKEIVHKTDFDEYVYDTASLKTFAGKSLHSKKSQLNKFYRECNGCNYNSITKEDMNDCLSLVEDWCNDRGYDKEDILVSDYLPIKIMFENFENLSIHGGVVRIFKKLIAFSMGSDILGDTAFVHFEKIDKNIPGANVAIISEVLENEYQGAKFVNREEDMGIEGLRIAKKSYNPVYMTEKYDFLLTKKTLTL